ncbi:MAG: DUF3307 domain-containing protein [Chloroflexales bacterium]|nr:DUF3307 domain-containing protein [Chloroflexales bacterium]
MFFLFFLAHLVADFVLQPLWLVQRKRYWSGLLIHGGIVLGCMLALPLLDAQILALWPVMLGITIVHVAADRWKVQVADRFFQPPLIPFLLDQAIHVITLGVALSLALPMEQVWAMEGRLIMPWAAYAIGYLIAAFAVPIGVMVWLDPAFKHAALAGRARARCLAASAAVLSLILWGGALALPVTLFGLALVAHRPISAHPLDIAPGLIVVLSITAMLGAMLTMLPM